ncbi:MAG: CinA family nicotinamide mononucleotide deamidase-related protein [Fibrobacterales bacterium]
MTQKLSIIAIGTELLNGKIQDTNTHAIARLMTAHGIHISHSLIIPDNEAALHSALDYCITSDAIIVTGGLGPTPDDQTRNYIARYLKKDLVQYPDAVCHIEECFSRMNRPVLPNQSVQTLFPEGATLLANPHGTALGFSVSHSNTIISVGPGVPHEVIPMVRTAILPLLTSGHNDEIYTRQLLSLNIGEGVQTELLESLTLPSGVEFSSLPELDGLRLSLSMSGSIEEIIPIVDTTMDTIIALFIKKGFGDEIISLDGSSLLTTLQKDCIKNSITLSTVESCTGGIIGGLLTALPGSSCYYSGGFVTYSNHLKTQLVGVSPNTLNDYGAVSSEVVREMALGCQKRTSSDYALAVSGIAGPDGGTPEKPVGLVWMAIAHPNGVDVFKQNFRGDRNCLRDKVSFYLLNELRKKINNYSDMHLHT